MEEAAIVGRTWSYRTMGKTFYKASFTVDYGAKFNLAKHREKKPLATFRISEDLSLINSDDDETVKVEP